MDFGRIFLGFFSDFSHFLRKGDFGKICISLRGKQYFSGIGLSKIDKNTFEHRSQIDVKTKSSWEGILALTRLVDPHPRAHQSVFPRRVLLVVVLR